VVARAAADEIDANFNSAKRFQFIHEEAPPPPVVVERIDDTSRLVRKNQRTILYLRISTLAAFAHFYFFFTVTVYCFWFSFLYLFLSPVPIVSLASVLRLERLHIKEVEGVLKL